MSKELKEKPRVGVFVCHCGVNIGGVVDVKDVVNYAKTLPSVVYSEANLHSCSSEGIKSIKEAIKNQNINRVVVASCTPRTHESLFRAVSEEAGVNKYLFQMVNIREQCSWVHSNEPKKATEKTKFLIQMAAAKARLLEPLVESEIEIEPSSLVIGAGISGMSASLCLANQGFKVYLIEKEVKVGGILNDLYKLYPTGLEPSHILHPIIEAVSNHMNISLLTSTVVKDVDGYFGNFKVKVERKGNDETEFKVGTIIVATGAVEYKPIGIYGYNKHADIITQLELEQLLKRGLEQKPKKVVMIQCAGAMEERGRTYCSRICCSVALKNALLIKELNPKTDVYILYRDLQAYGRKYEEYYLEAQKQGIKFLNYISKKPPKVISKPNEQIVEVYLPLIDNKISISCDLIVLSTPLIQKEESKRLSSILRVPLDSHGFFLEAHPKLRPVDFASDGIFMCGTAHSPKSVAESVNQAYAAASKASIPMAKRRVRTEAITAFVDRDLCVGCGACEPTCPFGAIRLSSFGRPRIIETICKGCGICCAECPMGAMQLRYFKDDQITSAVEGLLLPEKWINEEDRSKPVIVCFACRWCAYGAADLAGIMKMKYPVNVRIILVPCTGRVDALHILTAFIRGADGVIVAGCLKDGCHYIDGNIRAEKRVEVMKKMFEIAGITGRLEMYFMSAGMPDKFVELVTKFTQKIKETITIK